MSLWVIAALAKAPVPVVATGDAWMTPPEAPGGWVAVLGDCLEERAKGRFNVVDRATRGQTPEAVQEKVGTVLDLTPSIVLIGVTAPTSSDVAAFQTTLTALGRELTGRGAATLFVGIVDPAEQRWNAVLTAVAAEVPGVVHVDLGKDWPREDAARAALASDGFLTDQGHARVGAAACDAVLAYRKP